MAVVIEKEKCIGCRNCEAVCPADAIAVTSSGVAEVREERCLECGACMGDCEGHAIHWPK